MANKKETKKIEEKGVNDEIESFNVEEVKKEVLEYAEKNINAKIDELVRKADRRIIKQKNLSITKKNIIIIILLLIIGYLSYLLYNEGIFDKYFNHNAESVAKEISTVDEEENREKLEEETIEDTHKVLKEKYSYLLDKIYVTDSSNYLNEYYTGNLTNELKLSIALANVEEDKYIEEDGLYVLNSAYLKYKYSELFLLDNYDSISFKFNNIDLRYLKISNIYIISKLPKIEFNNIKREITNIKEVENGVEIYTTEALVKDSVIYNILNNEITINYEDNTNLSDYKDSLTNLKYKFIKNGDSYLLDSIECM